MMVSLANLKKDIIWWSISLAALFLMGHFDGFSWNSGESEEDSHNETHFLHYNILAIN